MQLLADFRIAPSYKIKMPSGQWLLDGRLYDDKSCMQLSQLPRIVLITSGNPAAEFKG